MEEFKQKRYFNSKKVKFKDDGIDYFSGNFLNARELFISYDEILVNTISREFKTNRLYLWITVASAFIFSVTLIGIFEIPDRFYKLLLPLSSLFFTFFLILTILSRKHLLYVSTFNGFLIDFYDKNPSEELIAKFLKTLRVRTYEYLKKKYAIIDKDLPIEKQIGNFNFLRERKVITEKEYEELKEKLKNIKTDVKGFKY